MGEIPHRVENFLICFQSKSERYFLELTEWIIYIYICVCVCVCVCVFARTRVYLQLCYRDFQGVGMFCFWIWVLVIWTYSACENAAIYILKYVLVYYSFYSLIILFEFLPDLLGLFGCERQKNTKSKWFQKDPSLLLISTGPPSILRCQGSSSLLSCCFPMLGFRARDYYLGQNGCWSFNHYNHIPTRRKGDRR